MCLRACYAMHVLSTGSQPIMTSTCSGVGLIGSMTSGASGVGDGVGSARARADENRNMVAISNFMSCLYPLVENADAKFI